MEVIYNWPTWMLVVAVFALMFGANEIGYRAGRFWHASEPDRAKAVSAGLKASILGLVALLLGFSYSMTTQRFNQRQRMVLDEANAIGTCFLRAGLLLSGGSTQASGQRMQDCLRRFVDLRLEHFERALEPAEYVRTSKAMDACLVELWVTVTEAVLAGPEMARTTQIVPAANAVIDLSATRAWASHNQVPASVVLLLAVCMVVTSAIIGHSSGQVFRRHLGLWMTANILVTLVFFVALDFDRPRRGLIQINHRPLVELRQSMRP